MLMVEKHGKHVIVAGLSGDYPEDHLVKYLTLCPWQTTYNLNAHYVPVANIQIEQHHSPKGYRAKQIQCRWPVYTEPCADHASCPTTKMPYKLRTTM